MMALIKRSQWQQTGITGDLAAGKIGADGLNGRRRRSAVVKHFVSSDGCSERECWVLKPSVHHSF
jgi:hypothetical protein